MDKRSTRLEWIEGLRSIACLCIFSHHFFATFYPVIIYGTDTRGASPATLALVQSPLSVVVNGNFWVCVFCIIAGYVASMPRFSTPQETALSFSRLSDSLIKRYLRLTLPAFVISLLVTLLYKGNFFSHLSFSERFDASWAALWYQEDIYTVKSLLVESFARLCFVGSDKYIVSLWTISYLFYGYYASILLAEMSWGKSKRILLVYGFVILCCVVSGLKLCIMSCFPIGTLLAYLSRSSTSGRRPTWHTAVALLMLLLGLFLGAFPTYFKPSNIYRFLDYAFLPTEAYALYHVIGSFLFMAALCQLPSLRHLLSGGLLVRLGKISFSLYLVHIPVILTIGTRTALFLFDHGVETYHLAVLVSLVITLCAVFLLSYAFMRLVEQPCGKLSQKLIESLRA